MNSAICLSRFWNTNLTLLANNDLSICARKLFQWTDMIIFFYALCLWFQMFHDRKVPLRPLPSSPLFKLKMILASLFLLLQIITVLSFNLLSSHDLLQRVDLLTCIIFVILAFIVLGFTKYEQSTGVYSSGLLFCFWFLVWMTILPDLIIITARYRQDKSFRKQVIRLWFHFLLAFSSFLSHCFAEKHQISSKEKQCTMPELYESIPSRLTFSWVNKLILCAYRKPLTEDDWWDLQLADRTDNVVARVQSYLYGSVDAEVKNVEKKILGEKSMDMLEVQSDEEENFDQFDDEIKHFLSVTNENKQKEQKTAVFWHALLCAFKEKLALGALLKLIFDLLALSSPLAFKALLKFFGDGSNSTWLGIFLTVLLSVIMFGQTMFFQAYIHQQTYFSLRSRSAIAGLVYRKSLKLSNSARQGTATGEIVNLMSVDASRFSTLASFIHLLWSSPFQMVLALILLYREMGFSMIPCGILLLLFVPLNISLNQYRRTLARNQMVLKDARVEMMNEVLNGIKVLKLYAWEPVFISRINEIREKELSVTRKRGIMTASSTILCTFAPIFLAMLTFATYILSSPDHILTADKAFVSLSIFNLLRTPLILFPYIFTSVVEAAVSNERIQKFLANEEIDANAVQRVRIETDSQAVTVENGTFRWTKLHSDPFVLKNINLEIDRGRLVAVVGSVGSGKSSILAALLGEMNKVSGNVQVGGRIGYVPQSAWILNATLQENILFGCDFDRTRYEQILGACALKPDLDILPFGDQTEIGEKGINLSGGQRARVSLARALYNDADIYLLDDPLSAIDAHVSAHIFRHVIGPEGLLKNKTRILVTHGVAHLYKCDEIFVMKEGQIDDHGSYDQLKISSKTFAEFVQLNATSEKSVSQTSEPVPDVLKFSQSDDIEHEEIQSSTVKTINGEQLIQKEAVQTDSAKLSIIWRYIRASGLFVWLWILICFCSMTVVAVASNVYLSKWTDEKKKTSNTTSGSHVRVMNIYFGLGLFQGLLLLVVQLLQVWTASSASVHLHRTLLKGVLRAPMSFFDCTPMGRIINRFAKDIDSLDNALPASFSSTLTTFSTVIVTAIVLIYSSWYALIAIILLAIPFVFIQRVYVASSRQLRQLDSTTKSPLYSNFTETLQGLSSIRAYNVQDRFIKLNDHRLDHNQGCFFASQVVCRWLGVRLEVLGNILTFVTSLFAVVMRDHLTVGTIGLAISFTMQITQSLSLLVLFTSDIESNIISVERIEEYAQLTSEAPWEIPEKKPSQQWPTHGKVQIENLTVRYRENLLPVIKDVTVQFESGEKIGIIGRTGSGKTSLCMALFRIIEAAEGKILIDGVDISQLGLHELRSKITIIPQDAIIFAGTVRFNVDPFEIYSDEEIWTALESVHIKQRILALTNDLAFIFTEGGNNLSAGEKQLLCMARALLRKSQIVVLDEATAAIDMETDRLIQLTIRTSLKNTTVITIAHRLHTIVDNTRIVVLSNGCLQEFDTPENLASNSHSSFAQLLKDANINATDIKTSLI